MTLHSVKSTPEEQFKQMDATALNINKSMLSLSLKNAEQAVALINKSIEEFSPAYNTNKEFYEAAKADFEKLDVQMKNFLEERESQENLIKTYKYAVRKELPINILSNPVIKQENALFVKTGGRKGKKTNVSWVQEAEHAIRKAGKFLTEEEMWYAFSQDKELVARANQNQTKFPTIKGAVLDIIITHALKFREYQKTGSTRYVQLLGIYKGKVGLAAWLDKEERPLPNHLAQFMHEDYPEGRAPMDVRIRKIRAVMMKKVG